MGLVERKPQSTEGPLSASARATRLSAWQTSRRRPRNAAELASWPTALHDTRETPLGAIVIAPVPGFPCVVLLHGWGADRTLWADAAMPLVDAGVGVLIPDLPGHGSSPELPSRRGEATFPHVERVAAQILDVVDSLGWQQVAVAGAAIGATVALAMVKTRRAMVERLMLVGPLLRLPTLRMLGLLAYDGGPGSATLRAQLRGLDAGRRLQQQAVINGFGGQISVVAGELDPFCPPSRAARVVRKARDRGTAAQFAAIDGVGEDVTRRRPDALAAAMMVWLER